MYFTTLTTPLGYMRAHSTGTALFRLDWQQTPFVDADRADDVSRETISELEGYMNGKIRTFTIPIDLSALSTSLQLWLQAMQKIPYGRTVSYAEFAALWGNRKAARAAGDACRRNPIPIIIPCHRVVKADGSYDNYSGGAKTHPRDPENIKRKQWLIEKEAEK